MVSRNVTATQRINSARFRTLVRNVSDAVLQKLREGQVISLWRINDDATRTFMEGYYQRLKAGEGRSAALRKVQLEMLQAEHGGGEQSHPYFWAGFIESLDWRSLR